MEVALLARHGESVYSVRSLLNGDPTVACGLTELGLEQARALGVELAERPIDLCVTSEFERTQLTAAEALAGRVVPRAVEPDLNDPRYGRFEGGPLEEYRHWADTAPSGLAAPGGGESRQQIAARYARGFRSLLERSEQNVFVVAHSLPLSVALAAADGIPPRPRAAMTAYATLHRFEHERLTRATLVIEQWLAAPDW
jgi:broad specificity phosphatase PhoE